jgi:hypothetical protein
MKQHRMRWDNQAGYPLVQKPTPTAACGFVSLLNHVSHYLADVPMLLLVSKKTNSSKRCTVHITHCTPAAQSLPPPNICKQSETPCRVPDSSGLMKFIQSRHWTVVRGPCRTAQYNAMIT